jgi:hypothetical protein
MIKSDTATILKALVSTKSMKQQRNLLISGMLERRPIVTPPFS